MKRMTKAQTAKVLDQVSDWMRVGVPTYITKYEAFVLTGGKVGSPIGINHSYEAIHLRDVALATQTAKAVR